MKKALKVYKFGGLSLKDAEAIRNVYDILKTHPNERLIVVVSAFAKVTDALENLVAAHMRNDGSSDAYFDVIKKRHFEVIDDLFEGEVNIKSEVQSVLDDIQFQLDKHRDKGYDLIYDQVVSRGEILSSVIVAAYFNARGLKSNWVDARKIVITDDIYREGWVQWDETTKNAHNLVAPLLDNEGVVITQGFIGSTANGYTTTLGREGSDYTAAILSYCLDAESMTIWKDVPGILTADPKLFDNITKLDLISYREAIEMTYYGAKVIHPKTIKPLQNKSIPMLVKSFLNPEGEGTYISDEVEDHYPPIVALEKEQALVQISTRDFSFVAEHHISEIFQHIADLRLQVNMMQNSAISFSVCFNDVDDKVDRFAENMERKFKVTIIRGLELITVRHYNETTVESLKSGKMLLLEERLRNTMQMVVKNVPVIERRRGS